MKIGSTNFLLAVLIAAMGLSSCERVDEGVGFISEERISLAEYENYKDFGDYLLHVNALGTNQLPPEVAQSAGIVRSDNRGMLNVVILKKLEASEDQPWAGAVKVAAANLAGQFRSIDMRKVTEQDAIYYIGEFAVSNQETLVFDIDVVPENETRRLAVRFTKQFYTR
jgi:hypothetical protein